MQKRVFILLAILLAISVGASATAASAAAPEVYYINLGHNQAGDSATHTALQEGFASYVEQQSGGRIQVSVYENSILGGPRELTESVQLNVLEMAYVDTSALSYIEPNVQVFDLPFLFDTAQTARSALRGELGTAVSSGLPAKGLRNLAYGETGFRHISTTSMAVTSPGDLMGLMIRTVENPIYLHTFAAWGAAPTPLAFAELYTALEVGFIDGQESTLPTIVNANLHKVQNHLTLTGHIYTPGMLLISNTFWSRLPPDLQQVVQQGAYAFQEMQYTLLDAETAAVLKELGTSMTVHELTAQQKARFVQAVNYVYDLAASDIDPALVALARKSNSLYK